MLSMLHQAGTARANEYIIMAKKTVSSVSSTGPALSMNMRQAPADYIAKRVSNTGAAYFVPVCTRAGQSWGKRCKTYQEAVDLVHSAGRRVVPVPGVSAEAE